MDKKVVGIKLTEKVLLFINDELVQPEDIVENGRCTAVVSDIVLWGKKIGDTVLHFNNTYSAYWYDESDIKDLKKRPDLTVIETKGDDSMKITKSNVDQLQDDLDTFYKTECEKYIARAGSQNKLNAKLKKSNAYVNTCIKRESWQTLYNECRKHFKD